MSLKKFLPAIVAERYKLPLPLESDAHALLNQIGLKRGCIRKGGLLDADKAVRMVLSDFRDGKLGRVTLDEP